MIQRIQSIYLLLATLCSCALFFFPVTYIRAYDIDIPLYIMGLKGMPSVAPFAFYSMTLMTCLTALFSLIAIFLFKNRKRQMSFCIAAFISNFILTGLLFVLPDKVAKDINGSLQFQITIFLPILTLFLLTLANKAIRKDEALVKSADRIR